jgi:hypothetical protein
MLEAILKYFKTNFYDIMKEQQTVVRVSARQIVGVGMPEFVLALRGNTISKFPKNTKFY